MGISRKQSDCVGKAARDATWCGRSRGLGQIERDLGRGEAARPLYEEAVALCRDEGDPLALAHTVRHLGDIHQDAGRAALAEPCYDEALALYRSHDRTAPLDLANRHSAAGDPEGRRRSGGGSETAVGGSEGPLCGRECAPRCGRMLGPARSTDPLAKKPNSSGTAQTYFAGPAVLQRWEASGTIDLPKRGLHRR